MTIEQEQAKRSMQLMLSKQTTGTLELFQELLISELKVRQDAEQEEGQEVKELPLCSVSPEA